ncbi:hypothetical protein A2U01_0082033, partial [Trifolium medium]|nr:hypothetical protein [Trifolium medium]
PPAAMGKKSHKCVTVVETQAWSALVATNHVGGCGLAGGWGKQCCKGL